MTKTLSVLIISPPPQVYGGVVTFIETLKKNLMHCKVTSLYVGSEKEGGDPVPIKIIRTLKTLMNLVRLIRTNHFDVIHINPSLTYDSAMRDGLILFVLRLMGQKNILVYFHGWRWEVMDHIKRGPWHPQIFGFLFGVGQIFVLAPEFKDALKDIGIPDKHIHVATTLFDGNEFTSEFAPESTTRNILYLSRFDAKKGIYELLAAFVRIARDFPDVTLTFAGNGVENTRLRREAQNCGLSERITFTGYVSGMAKTELLQRCTLFALPTYISEGMPIALLEAMAAGKPLLTAKAGGIPHIIREPENGIVLDDVTVENVANALRKLLSHPDACKEIGEHNARYAWERFEAKTVSAQMEAAYETLAQS